MADFYRISNRSPALIAILLASLVGACKAPVQEQQHSQPDPVSEQFVKANQYMQQRHQDHIAAFVERTGWEARVTPTGLWIVIEEPGEGSTIRENSKVTFTYDSKLLDGTPCYSATFKKPEVITIGKGGVESGVGQGLKYLREGAEAVLLIPPHLAHGNFGDRDKIPGNSTLIYSLKVLNVE